MNPKPSIGRVVHYVANDSGSTRGLVKHFPALITQVNENGNVNLTVIPDGLNYIIPVRQAIHSDEFIPGTWHWPERIE